MPEQINPDHYQKEIETFTAISSQLSKQEVIGYLRFSIMKYVCRFGAKHNDTQEAKLMDIGKAEWYTNKLLQYLNDHG